MKGDDRETDRNNTPLKPRFSAHTLITINSTCIFSFPAECSVFKVSHGIVDNNIWCTAVSVLMQFVGNVSEYNQTYAECEGGAQIETDGEACAMMWGAMITFTFGLLGDSSGSSLADITTTWWL